MKKILLIVLAFVAFSCQKVEDIAPIEDCQKGIATTDSQLQGTWDITSIGTVTILNGSIGSKTYEVTNCGQSFTISDGTKITFFNPVSREYVQVDIEKNGTIIQGTMVRQ